ncbi:hypothetical protein V7S43_018071 [Phytophthora oleae]|uniref:PKD domain-containing protein n=1 Tax=Phytophthora oleae TaxID=2107226 RepID=A0ABD3ERF8_9STRA
MGNTANADEFWTVRCAPGSAVCDENASFVLLASGTYDVTVRYEDAAENDDVARVSVNSVASDSD